MLAASLGALARLGRRAKARHSALSNREARKLEIGCKSLPPAPTMYCMLAASLGALARLGRRAAHDILLLTAGRESRGMRGNRDTENALTQCFSPTLNNSI